MKTILIRSMVPVLVVYMFIAYEGNSFGGDGLYMSSNLELIETASKVSLRQRAAAAKATAESDQEAGALPETLVTIHPIVDPEFDQDNAQFTYSDLQGRLWIGNVDRATGDFIPRDGRAIFVDSNVAPASDFGNGPEWLFTDQGHWLVYTKYLDDEAHTMSNARCGVAKNQGGKWVGDFIPFEDSFPCFSPFGTLNEGDADPKVSFHNSFSRMTYYTEVYSPAVIEQVPYSNTSLTMGRWVEGTHEFILPLRNSTGDTGQEMFTYDTDTKVLNQLTYDDAEIKVGGFMWKAPEYANEYVFFTTVNTVNGTGIQVYRMGDDGSGKEVWTAFSTIRGTDSYPYITSPEPFTYNGKSYILMQLGPTPGMDKTVPTQIAISSIDPENPDFRLLTNDSRSIHMDPEVFITDQGPFIYYNRYLLATERRPFLPVGIWRVDTGLLDASFH